MNRRSYSIALMIVVAGCGAQDRQVTAPAEPNQPAVAVLTPKIPAEVSYPIIEDKEEYNAFSKKRMVKVKLNMRVSSEVLREIALAVKSSEKRQYEQTFIFYYLPEDVSGVKASPWGTSHFNPTLDVSIMGITKEDEAALRSMPITHPGTRIGAWLIDRGLVVLYDGGGAVEMADIFPKGGRHVSEMVEVPTERGRWFKKVDGSDIYAVDESGTLRLYAADGELLAGVVRLR